MKNIGSTLLLLGVGTIVLNLIGYEFRILMWIDNWGESVGWAIRAALIVAGGVLFALGQRAEKAASAEPAESPRQEPTFSAAAPEPPDPQPAVDPTLPPREQ